MNDEELSEENRYYNDNVPCDCEKCQDGTAKIKITYIPILQTVAQIPPKLGSLIESVRSKTDSLKVAISFVDLATQTVWKVMATTYHRAEVYKSPHNVVTVFGEPVSLQREKGQNDSYAQSLQAPSTTAPSFPSHILP
jgi:hypothetical protein